MARSIIIEIRLLLLIPQFLAHLLHNTSKGVANTKGRFAEKKLKIEIASHPILELLIILQPLLHIYGLPGVEILEVQEEPRFGENHEFVKCNLRALVIRSSSRH